MTWANRCPLCAGDMASCPCGWTREGSPPRWTMTAGAFARAREAQDGLRGEDPAPEPGNGHGAGEGAEAEGGTGDGRGPAWGEPPPLQARPVSFGPPGDPRPWVWCANEMSARICGGAYTPGVPLPPMSAIAREMGLSYNTARKAYIELRAAGLASSTAQGTCYVAGNPPGGGRPLPGGGELLTVVEVAVMLRVSEMTVYRMMHAGEIESVQAGKQYRITGRSIRDRIERTRKGPPPYRDRA